jgi:hypothetical protein
MEYAKLGISTKPVGPAVPPVYCQAVQEVPIIMPDIGQWARLR